MASSFWSRILRLHSQIRHSSSSSQPFGPPPSIPQRRVVVTGLGMVTPLGCGVETTWKRLVDGKCGIRAIGVEDLKMDKFDKETQLHTFEQLSSKVAAVVPCGTNEGEFNEEIWTSSKEHRSIARFIAYALCSTEEALRDANWFPSEQDKERTVQRPIKADHHQRPTKAYHQKTYKGRSSLKTYKGVSSKDLQRQIIIQGLQRCIIKRPTKADHHQRPTKAYHQKTYKGRSSSKAYKGTLQNERVGVSIGGGTGSISDILDAAQLICEKRLRRLSPFFIPRILINMAAGHVSMKYGFKGPNHAAVTACATGAHSIGDATRMIQFGDADVMIAGGTESSIDALSIAGFCRSRALATRYNSLPDEASRPFDCGRDGFVIGEGSGVMVLEELEHAQERGAKIYAEVRGYGMSGDAYHITQPHSDGGGAMLAMSHAIKQSGLHPNQVDYVNAHATSTPLGDAIEAAAIKSVFSDHVTSGALAFSSTKGATGHLLGAAGAVEAIFTVLGIYHGIAPLTLNLNQPDPIFENSFMPLTASKEMTIRAAISNSFGFGGTNASLLFASAP